MSHTNDRIPAYLTAVASAETREMYDYFTSKSLVIEEIRHNDEGVSFCFRSPHEDYCAGAFSADDWHTIEIGISDCYVGGICVNWKSKRMFLDPLIPVFIGAIAKIPEYDDQLC